MTSPPAPQAGAPQTGAHVSPPADHAAKAKTLLQRIADLLP